MKGVTWNDIREAASCSCQEKSRVVDSKRSISLHETYWLTAPLPNKYLLFIAFLEHGILSGPIPRRYRLLSFHRGRSPSTTLTICFDKQQYHYGLVARISGCPTSFAWIIGRQWAVTKASKSLDLWHHDSSVGDMNEWINLGYPQVVLRLAHGQIFAHRANIEIFLIIGEWRVRDICHLSDVEYEYEYQYGRYSPKWRSSVSRTIFFLV